MSATQKAEGAAAPGPQPTPGAEAQETLRERLGPKLEEAQERLAETNERVKRFVRANPGACLLGAAAVGFLLGRWAARR